MSVNGVLFMEQIFYRETHKTRGHYSARTVLRAVVDSGIFAGRYVKLAESSGRKNPSLNVPAQLNSKYMINAIVRANLLGSLGHLP